MGTYCSEIVDVFLSRIDDYIIDNIFINSGSLVGTNYLEPFLMDAIDEFSDIADQDLTYNESSAGSEGYFNQVLNRRNKDMLSQLMVRSWLAKTIQKTLQLQNFVTDRDFSTFSAAQNLKAKQDYYIVKCEEIDRLLNRYAYKNADWTDWNNQNFNGITPPTISN